MRSNAVKIIFALLLVMMLDNHKTVAQTSNEPLPDKELAAIILKDVLAKDYKDFPFVVMTKNSATDIKYVLASKPNAFFDSLQLMFGVTEESAIRKLLSASYSLNLRTGAYPKAISLVEDTLPAKNRVISKQSNNALIVDVLIILYKKTEEKCLVYFHIINNGTSYAILEKRNNIWQVTDLKNLMLE